MFARFVTLLPLATLAAVAAASPSVLEARNPPTCNSGSVNCCNKTFTQTEYFSGVLGGLLTGLDVLLGLQCDAITVVGVLSDGTTCTQQTACCKNVNQSGVINVACSPVAV